jgi:uncharacterized membrane protein
MKALRTPAIVLAAFCAGLLIYLACSVPLLPERVATHFGVGGEPNGWMNRSTHLIFVGAVGVGLPLLSIVIALVIRLIPARFVNLPHREYWLSPERRSQTCIYVSQQMLWLGCLEVLFFAGIQYLTIQANSTTPTHLPMDMFLTMVGGFLVAVALWIIVFIRHFAKAV